jgi:hypothetical protein
MAAGWERAVIEHYSDGMAPFGFCRSCLENFHIARIRTAASKLKGAN